MRGSVAYLPCGLGYSWCFASFQIYALSVLKSVGWWWWLGLQEVCEQILSCDLWATVYTESPESGTFSPGGAQASKCTSQTTVHQIILKYECWWSELTSEMMDHIHINECCLVPHVIIQASLNWHLFMYLFKYIPWGKLTDHKGAAHCTSMRWIHCI